MVVVPVVVACYAMVVAVAVMLQWSCGRAVVLAVMSWWSCGMALVVVVML